LGPFFADLVFLTKGKVVELVKAIRMALRLLEKDEKGATFEPLKFPNPLNFTGLDLRDESLSRVSEAAAMSGHAHSIQQTFFRKNPEIVKIDCIKQYSILTDNVFYHRNAFG